MATGYDDGAPILGEPTGLTRRSEVNKQGELLDPPEPGERTVTVAGVTDPVARVLLDSPVPHLDRTFDYLVPVAMAQEARPGTRVIVRFGEQEMRGWIWERGTTTTHIGRLSPLRRVVSDLQVLPKSSRRLIEAVAARSAGTRSDVVRLALPARHRRTWSPGLLLGPSAAGSTMTEGRASWPGWWTAKPQGRPGARCRHAVGLPVRRGPGAMVVTTASRGS